ncbi:MAG: hypothetical protein P8L37_03930 [Phycisphaerales bacterium]|nr:hypothetical protein [Phycisphaerales bacterium]
MRNFITICSGTALSIILIGCIQPNFDRSKATYPYPFELHTTNTLPIQVFRDGRTIEVVNSTDHHWENARLWVNQQFMHSLDSLQPGEHIVLNLADFRNDLGEEFSAGGFFSTRRPTPVQLIEVQPGEGQPLIGLLAIGDRVLE